MDIAIQDAHRLALDVLTLRGMPADHAGIVADHLVDAAMAGHQFAGLPRVLALVEHLGNKGPGGRIEVVREDERSALVDGGDVNGYVGSLVAIDKAIEIARRSGVAVVGVRNTWFSGRLAYYVERAARQDLIAFHTANVTARVAPHGGMDPIFGTNPMAFSFPCDGEPLTVDFGTSGVTWGEVLLRQRTGRPLDEGTAIGPDGEATTDPTAALAGAFLPWGAHRGYGLSLVVQVLGILAGSKVVVDGVGQCGFFFLVFDPALLMPASEFKARVAELKSRIVTSRPAGDAPVRVPGAGSQAAREAARQAGTIPVDEKVLAALRAIVNGKL